MRQDIVTIPIGEVFEPKDGCPICRLRDMLETRMAEYITGAAMMEPDIRIETNKRGFCFPHYQMLLKQRNRLGVALMLESHLNELEGRVFGSDGLFKKNPAKQGKDAAAAGESCFVCHHVNDNMRRMVGNACRLWESDGDFRRLFEEQPSICLPHFAMLCEVAQTEISRKNLPDFQKMAASLCRKSLNVLQEDVSHFCRMFDYRNNTPDADWGNSRDSVERAVDFLTSRHPNA